MKETGLTHKKQRTNKTRTKTSKSKTKGKSKGKQVCKQETNNKEIPFIAFSPPDACLADSARARNLSEFFPSSERKK